MIKKHLPSKKQIRDYTNMINDTIDELRLQIKNERKGVGYVKNILH